MRAAPGQPRPDQVDELVAEWEQAALRTAEAPEFRHGSLIDQREQNTVGGVVAQ